MKLIIQDKDPLKHQNEYEVEMEFMSGDADGTDYRSFFFKGEENAIFFIKEVKKLMKKKRNSWWYRPEYIDGESKYDRILNTPSQLINVLLGEDWPIDSHCGDWDRGAALYDFKVFYWNEHGARLDVEVKENKRRRS